MTDALYNADYYKTGCGRDYSDLEFWSPVFERIADRIIEDFAPKTVLDAGCAYGYLVAALRDRGVQAFGIDISKHAIANVRDNIKSYCSVCSLTDPLPENFPDNFDLITCIEVLEHMYEDEGTLAIENLCKHTENIIFSSTPSDLKEPTHFNVQQQEYWAKRFAVNGLYNQITYSANYISPVAVYFKRSDFCPKIIEDYERNTRIIKQNLNDALLRNSELSNQNSELQKAFKEQQKNISDLDKKNIMAEKMYQEIISSRSWRITKPIRLLLDQFKKKRHNLGKLADVSKIERQRQVRHIFLKDIKISILVPLYNTPEKFLCEMIESVQKQTYFNWELCMADGSDDEHKSVMEICEKYCAVDKRIKYKKLEKNLGISLNTNECIKMATGEYIALFDHDDVMHQSALFYVMEAVCEKDAHFVYTDEATFSGELKNIVSIHWKPDYAVDNLRANNYICHLSVFSKELLDKVGWFNPEYDGSQDHDLVLRLTEMAENVVHIPKVLYFWRSHPGSVALDLSSKMYAVDAGHKLVQENLKRRGICARVSSTYVYPTIYRIEYELIALPQISILVIDEGSDYLEKCLDSIITTTTYPNYEVLIINKKGTEKSINSVLSDSKKIPIIKQLKCDVSFNYAQAANFGVRHASGEYVVFVGNEAEVISPQWLEEMLMYAQRKDVGAVGAKLYYKNGSIRHAGLILGSGPDGVAESMLHLSSGKESGYMGRLCYAQNFMAVSAACMMTRKALFDEMGGMCEKFEREFYDVDYCLKLIEKGYLNVFTPFAELYCGSMEFNKDHINEVLNNQDAIEFKQKWGKIIDTGDPYYNNNLKINSPDFFINYKFVFKNNKT